MAVRRRLVTIAVLAGGLAGAGCDAPGDADPDPVALGVPTDTVYVPELVVSGAAWLGGDRWVVTAPEDGSVRVLSLGETDSSAAFGTAGAFLNPHTAFSRGDTLFVGDWGYRRVTMWSAGGELVDTIGALAPAGGALPRAVDAAGRLYAEAYPLPGAAGRRTAADSGVVVRVSPDLSRVDTVARLAPYDVAEVREEGGVRIQRRALSGSDVWGVLPDGRIWVARVDQNRVDWISPEGEVTRGRGMPDRVLEVTRVDRELFVRQYPPELRSQAERLPFAVVKPPFTSGFTGGANRVWLEKSRAVGDSVRRYAVVDPDSGFLGEFHLRGHGRILATGDGAALLIEGTGGENGTRVMALPVP